ncbi:MAG: mandelate racemase/muconate lactonizing enzyme family protein [Kiloniellales bacterium]|nr:mandelate racemase/muconate lactonizing enzyme family protein [Kiloniellales bacterium]
MKIAAIKTYLLGPTDSPDGAARVKSFLFVKLETDAGLEAWGEAYALAGRERAVEEMILALAETLLGREAPSPRCFRSDALLRFADKRAGIDFYCAVSALELALWDLAGKHLGAPVHRLLGGALRDRIPLYANTWSEHATSIDFVVGRARQMVEAGYRAVKVYPLQFAGLDRAEACLQAVRQALGQEIAVMVDLNALDDPHIALQAARRFEPYDPFWFEEPVSSDDLETLADIRARASLRIVSGERHGGKFRFREMLEKRAADVLNPDIAGCGGILELLEIAAMAEAFSVAVSPHNYNSTTVAMAAMLHAAALLPNLLTAEIYPDFLARGAAFAETDFEIRDGEATLPQSPGLGVTLDEEALIALTGGARARP